MSGKIFTPSQSEAIFSGESDIVVLAGPGSGKTEVFTQRINLLLMNMGARPAEIVALTFTNAGAREIEKRLNGSAKLGYCGTLHGFALMMLKAHGAIMGYGERMTVINPENAADLLASKASSLGCKLAIAKLMKLKSEIGCPSGKMTLPETVLAAYYDDLRGAGMVDFDVLLTEFARMLEETDAIADRFLYLFVDEVQDSGPVDWRIYRALKMQKFFVGDPDQSIFGFRGGNVLGLLTYIKRERVQVIKLQENFRSHAEICATANELISHNANRVEKKTISTKGPGGEVHVFPPDRNGGAEIAAVLDVMQDLGTWGDGSVAVLTRTNHLADEYAAALDAAGFKVSKRGERDLPKDFHLARTLVDLLVYPENDTLGFFYLIARATARGDSPAKARAQAHEIRKESARAFSSINKTSLGLASNLSAERASRVMDSEGISLESQMLIAEKLRELPDGSPMIELAFLLAMNPKPSESKEKEGEVIHCLTLHGAKGKEFDSVFLVGFEDEIIPGQRKNADIEEERRLAYVGITRARKRLYVFSSRSRITKWKAIESHRPSRFIEEMEYIDL
jgi:DNA helicase-2/ATP-dependent DNA helicase PcrA